MRPISKSGGSRQRIWDILRGASRPLPASEIATRAGCALPTAWGYLGGLKSHGYAETSDEGWRIVKDTGKRSPSINLNTGTVHDWNIDKPMSAAELKRAVKHSKLSLNQFGAAVGLGLNNGVRLRQMMSGQRPVSPQVEAGARKFINRKD